MKQKSLFSYLNLISEIGLLIGISTVGGVLIGVWLDGKFKTKGIFSILFLLFGLTGGLLSSYRLIMELDKKDGRDS